MTRVKVTLFSPLQRYTDNKNDIECEGKTVFEVLRSILKMYPALEGQLFRDLKLHDFINVFLNGESIRDLNGLETKIEEDAELFVVPAIAGG